MSNIDIRPATKADLDAITEIYADAVTHGTASYELEPPTRAEMAARFEALAAGGFPYLVAENEAGGLAAMPMPDLSGRARPTASSSRIRSMSRPRPRAGASAGCCSKG